MTTELSATSVTHADIKRILHPRLGVEVDGRTCVRTLRFRRKVKLDYLDFRYGWGGAGSPMFPRIRRTCWSAYLTGCAGASSRRSISRATRASRAKGLILPRCRRVTGSCLMSTGHHTA